MAIERLEPPRARNEGRSQTALEIMLNIYALFSVAVLARLVLEIGSVVESVWVGRMVYPITDPLVRPLEQLPGANFTIIGNLGLPDLTLLGLTVLIPLGIVGRAAFRPPRRA